MDAQHCDIPLVFAQYDIGLTASARRRRGE